MTIMRQSSFIKFMAYLILALMMINPALALQYQRFNSTADFLSKIPNFQPKSYHIHASQKDKVIDLLHKQGYDVIQASAEDVAHFMQGQDFSYNKPLQYAANFNLKSAYEKDCPPNVVTCYAEECDKYSKERRKDCDYDEPPVVKKKPEAKPKSSGSVSVGANLHIPNIRGGGSKDSAAAFLIVIGVIVIAALFIYAGKWIADALKNDEDYYAYWWDLGMQITRLDTSAGEHGTFNGLKLSGGFVPNMHTNFGLAVEIGRMNLDLNYNQNSHPQRINIEGTYWLIGPSVRWLIGNRDAQENLFNSSYIYLTFMGGSSDRREVDKIASAKIGINTAIGEHLRLGLHYGAFYLGLNEDQGFANDGDNYWNMYGMELGYQF